MFNTSDTSARDRDTFNSDLARSTTTSTDEQLDFSDSLSEYGTATMNSIKQIRGDTKHILRIQQQQQESDCYLCGNDLSKSYTCYICDAIVCGPCSRRTINEEKACDLCFLRCFLKKTEQRRNEQVGVKQQAIVQLVKQQMKMKEDIQQVSKEITNVKANSIQKREEFAKGVETSGIAISRIERDINDIDDQIESVRDRMREEKETEQSLELELNCKKQILQGLDTDIEQKNRILEQKQLQVRNLIDQKNNLTSTKSFADYRNKQEQEYMESDDDDDNDEEYDEDDSQAESHDNGAFNYVKGDAGDMKDRGKSQQQQQTQGYANSTMSTSTRAGSNNPVYDRSNSKKGNAAQTRSNSGQPGINSTSSATASNYYDDTPINAKNQTRNYELNQKQPATDKCLCTIF